MPRVIGMNVVDPPSEYYGRNYYAVYFTDLMHEAGGDDLGSAAESFAAAQAQIADLVDISRADPASG